MTQKGFIYKCPICGNIVEVLHQGAGELICCGQPMQLMKENSVDASIEKHVPVVERADGVIKVKVGSVAHPMEDTHYIEWIECVDCGCRKMLKPGDQPEAEFNCCGENCQCGGQVRAYCNLHGLWKSN